MSYDEVVKYAATFHHYSICRASIREMLTRHLNYQEGEATGARRRLCRRISLCRPRDASLRQLSRHSSYEREYLIPRAMSAIGWPPAGEGLGDGFYIVVAAELRYLRSSH